jgi:hypothetical protein
VTQVETPHQLGVGKHRKHPHTLVHREEGALACRARGTKFYDISEGFRQCHFVERHVGAVRPEILGIL